MREIRFRAWDKGNGRFVYSALQNAGHYYFSVTLDDAQREDIGDWEQFTGLHDKNGKEIYEGDILEFTHEPEWEDPSTVRRVVKWQERYGAGWSFGISHKDGDKRWSYAKPYQPEIIGNIHENPELLTKDPT